MTTEASQIAANIVSLRERIGLAAARAGRQPDEVRLVAVSKTVAADLVAAAIEAGVCDFGENRSQLFCERAAAFPGQDWHFIGRIQSNKVKDFAGRAALVHSVASEKALRCISEKAQALGEVQKCLIEVNTSGEASKDGVRPAELPQLLDAAVAFAAVKVVGLMTMAPIAPESVVRQTFAALRELRDSMSSCYSGHGNVELHELSMGMSDDFEIAIEEGATIVRIGRSVWL
ncbi:MAG: YggS family pyridoxal phosphate-dependent enzyme [Actinomycetia bacterium]|nr:YggS family pyridoxal phosphate-dependent enzyme [Actinomycetes bacterium]